MVPVRVLETAVHIREKKNNTICQGSMLEGVSSAFILKKQKYSMYTSGSCTVEAETVTTKSMLPETQQLLANTVYECMC